MPSDALLHHLAGSVSPYNHQECQQHPQEKGKFPASPLLQPSMGRERHEDRGSHNGGHTGRGRRRVRGTSAHGRMSSRWRVRTMLAPTCWQRRSCQGRSGDSCHRDTALRCQPAHRGARRGVSKHPFIPFSCHRTHADAFPVSRRPTGRPLRTGTASTRMAC